MAQAPAAHFEDRNYSAAVHVHDQGNGGKEVAKTSLHFGNNYNAN